MDPLPYYRPFAFRDSMLDPDKSTVSRNFPPEDRDRQSQDWGEPVGEKVGRSIFPDLNRIGRQARDGAVVGKRPPIGRKDDPPGAFDRSQPFPFHQRQFLIKGIIHDLEIEKSADNNEKTDQDKNDCDRCSSFHCRFPAWRTSCLPPEVRLMF
jgi:hypothetical protein